MATEQGASWLHRLVGSLAALLVCGLLPPALAAQEEQRAFRFAPPDATSYIETVSTVQVLDFGAGRTSATRSELQLEGRIARIASGYALTETVTGGTSVSAHQEMDQAILAAMKGKLLTYTVDSSGHLLDVTGMEPLVEAIRKALPADVAELAAMAFAKDALLAAARAEWGARIEGLIGRSAAPGSAWLVDDSYLLPNGDLAAYYTAMKVVAVESVAGHDCVRIEYRSGCDPDQFRQFLGETYAAATAGKHALPGNVVVSGSGSRLVDPMTLLCYGEELDRRFDNVIVTIPDRGEIPISIRQTKSYRYSYR
jgi:hypothetical protein